MFHVITARNVNGALEQGLHYLARVGKLTESRNGPVLVAPGPVATAFLQPTERVLWSPLRDANPFFHLFESMWMLAGRNDTAALVPLVPRMQYFSDDQKTLNGAYGYRWREYFGFDQLREAADMLRKDATTRRVVIAMWDAMGSSRDAETGIGMMVEQSPPDLLNQGSKDLPCNTHIYFDATRGNLDMTVCCRSNDVVWGAYGANSVHMSFLHEWMAAAAGLKLGVYYQMSNNYHIYVDRPDVCRLIDAHSVADRSKWRVKYTNVARYGHDEVLVCPLVGKDEGAALYFLTEMQHWCSNGGHLASPSFRFTSHVLNPAMTAHVLYKAGDFIGAQRTLAEAHPSDWVVACQQWLRKRWAARLDKEEVAPSK